MQLWSRNAAQCINCYYAMSVTSCRTRRFDTKHHDTFRFRLSQTVAILAACATWAIQPSLCSIGKVLNTSSGLPSKSIWAAKCRAIPPAAIRQHMCSASIASGASIVDAKPLCPVQQSCFMLESIIFDIAQVCAHDKIPCGRVLLQMFSVEYL